MSNTFENITGQGRTIAAASDELAKAGLLLEQEKNPEQQPGPGPVQENAAAHLGSCIDHFIDDCQPRAYGPGVSRYPGAFKILREVFAPVMGLGGKKTPQEASATGARVLDRIVWCLSHQQELVDLAAHQKGLDSLSEGARADTATGRMRRGTAEATVRKASEGSFVSTMTAEVVRRW